jgi:hypothetical protein
MLTRNRKILLLGVVVVATVTSGIRAKILRRRVAPGFIRGGCPGLVGNGDSRPSRAAIG